MTVKNFRTSIDISSNFHYFTDSALRNCGIISHVRLTMFPDGGVSRLRLWGYRESKPGSKL